RAFAGGPPAPRGVAWAKRYIVSTNASRRSSAPAISGYCATSACRSGADPARSSSRKRSTNASTCCSTAASDVCSLMAQSHLRQQLSQLTIQKSQALMIALANFVVAEIYFVRDLAERQSLEEAQVHDLAVGSFGNLVEGVADRAGLFLGAGVGAGRGPAGRGIEGTRGAARNRARPAIEAERSLWRRPPLRR